MFRALCKPYLERILDDIESGGLAPADRRATTGLRVVDDVLLTLGLTVGLTVREITKFGGWFVSHGDCECLPCEKGNV